MYRFIVFTLFLLIAKIATAQPHLTIQNAKVTNIRVYETADNSTLAWIHLNGNQRSGPNPSNSEYQCELWTKTDSVYSAAMTALVSGTDVDVQYVDRGEGTYWCTVRTLLLRSN